MIKDSYYITFVPTRNTLFAKSNVILTAPILNIYPSVNLPSFSLPFK